MTDKIQFEKIISEIPDVMKYKDSGSRIPLLQKILDAADSPDLKFPTIHICGTNGKGSTSKMIAGLLMGVGLKVGVFSSPPMYDDREQIQVNGEIINFADFVASYAVLKNAFSKIGLNQADISMFETWYLVSIIYFAQKQVDYVIYECGLGGEFDATNATRNVLYAVFTKIDMDHMNILGSTIEEIATTKSKIIKPNIFVIDYPEQNSKVTHSLKKEADKQGANFYNSSDNNVALDEEKLTSSVVSLFFNHQRTDDLRFNLGGLYQIANLQNVLNWVEIFNQNSDIKITPDDLKQMIQTVTLSGRMELIQENPPVVIDGAHNINAINGLVESLERLNLKRPLILVVGFLADKQYQRCVDRLLNLEATFIITSPKNDERALPARKLERIFKNDPDSCQKTIILADSIEDSVEKALDLQQKSNGLVFFTGSFYLINQIKPLLERKRG